MSGERDSGLHAVLGRPAAYTRFQRWLGEPKVYAMFVDEHLRPRPGERVVDLGCGPADILGHMPPGVDYVGFDPNPRYVEAARARWGDRGRFEVAGVEELTAEGVGPADAVMAFGVVHHLDDDVAAGLFELAAGIVGPEGRCVVLDPFFEEGQSWLARLVLRLDRGQRVRTVDRYLELAAPAFETVETTLHPGMLRLPFGHTHRVVECRNARSLAATEP